MRKTERFISIENENGSIEYRALRVIVYVRKNRAKRFLSFCRQFDDIRYGHQCPYTHSPLPCHEDIVTLPGLLDGEKIKSLGGLCAYEMYVPTHVGKAIDENNAGALRGAVVYVHYIASLRLPNGMGKLSGDAMASSKLSSATHATGKEFPTSCETTIQHGRKWTRKKSPRSQDDIYKVETIHIDTEKRKVEKTEAFYRRAKRRNERKQSIFVPIPTIGCLEPPISSCLLFPQYRNGAGI